MIVVILKHVGITDWDIIFMLKYLKFQHDNAEAPCICTQFLEAENVPVLPWPAYSADMSPIEHVWDALDRQSVPVPANIQQLRTSIEEEWDNIPQATINSLINYM
jgi:transposase